MLKLIKGIGLDQQKVTIQFSGAYESEHEDHAYLYTRETKEVKGKPFTRTTKKYTLDLLDDQWLITGVEQDKFTFGSEKTQEEIKSKLNEMKYQKNKDQPIEYDAETLVLQGVAAD